MRWKARRIGVADAVSTGPWSGHEGTPSCRTAIAVLEANVVRPLHATERGRTSERRAIRSLLGETGRERLCQDLAVADNEGVGGPAEPRPGLPQDVGHIVDDLLPDHLE